MSFRGILKTAGRGIGKGAGAVWRHRVTILKIIGLAAGAALCLWPTIYLNSIYGYLPIFFYVLLLILSGIYLLILRRTMSSTAEDRIVTCQRTSTEEFCLDIRNRSILVAPKVTSRITMHSESTGSGQDTVMTMALTPKEDREFKFDITFAHLGHYQVGIGDIRVGGLLGLFEANIEGGGTENVYVTPLQHHPGSMALTDLVETEDSRARASSPRDGSDYTGVREYTIGDPMKNIHWKLSAHSNTYMTKQMEVLGNAGVDVVLDLAAPPWEGEDGAFMYDALVESACAVILYARDQGMDCSIWYFDRSHQERNMVMGAGDDLDQLADDLPGITSLASEYELDELLSHAVNSLYVKNNIVLCTARSDEYILRRLEEIQAARRHPALIYVIPPGLSQRQREDRIAPTLSLRQRDIPCQVITTVQELK